MLYSVDFHQVERLQQAQDWPAAGTLLAHCARTLESAGADFLVLCTNTMHNVAPAIEAAVRVPLLHIADAIAAEIKQAGFSSVGLLGTRFTMEQDFYRTGYASATASGADPQAARPRNHSSHHLRRTMPRPDRRRVAIRVLEDRGRLVVQGAQAIILGCTEISLLVGPQDLAVPLFDTTSIHARQAAAWALAAG